MKKEWAVKIIISVSVSTTCFLGINGCKKSDDGEAKVIELSRQVAPLQVCRADKNIKTITLTQAMDWHESHELEYQMPDEEVVESIAGESQTIQPHHFCLGVVIGYKAIRYATNELFQEDIPNASDFDIKVNGPMDGIWDVMNLYTGKNLRFGGELQKIDLTNYAFTAERFSLDKSFTFRLREGLIPEEFFVLKNQGATCGNPRLREVKQRALLNILSAEPEICFQAIDTNSITIPVAQATSLSINGE